MGAELSSEDVQAAYDVAERSMTDAELPEGLPAVFNPAGSFARDRLVERATSGGGSEGDRGSDGDDESGTGTLTSTTRHRRMEPAYVATPRRQQYDIEAMLREKRRKRRLNYKHEREQLDKQVKEKIKASKGGCCGGKKEESEETPTDPGSDFSDTNYYRSRNGARRRRHARDAADPFQNSDSMPSSPAAGYYSVPHQAILRVVVMVELRERMVMAEGEAAARSCLVGAFAVILESSLKRRLNGSMSHGPPTEPQEVQREAETYAKAREIVESSPQLAEAFNLLFHNPSLPAKSKAALVATVSRLLEDPKDGQLLSLDLSGIQLGDDGALLATRVLRTQRALASIALASTGLTDFGLDVITVTMDAVDPPSLTLLDLSGNRITFNGAFRLITRLSEIYTPSRPAKHGFTVDLEGNDRLWQTGRSNAKALLERVNLLAQSHVAVQLPEPPSSD
jgi:hypothetical protein